MTSTLPACFRFIFAFALAVLPAIGEELPKLIAHRGASEQAPENTLVAIRTAWQQGADGIEADFLLSADGEVVCIHDNTTKRTANKNLKVSKSTLAELRALDYGAWKSPEFKGEKIPVLSEVLDEIPSGKWFFLEIKDSPKIVKPIAEILSRKRPDRERLILISFDKEVVKTCRETIPGYRACLISSLKNFSKKGAPERFMAELESCGAQGLIFKESAPVTKEWLTQAGGANRILMAWTINRRRSAIRATKLGSTFLATDRPGALRKELQLATPMRQ